MYYLFLILLSFTFTLIQAQTGGDVVNAIEANVLFDLADLTTVYSENEDLIQLEAFRSGLNEKILSSKNASDYGKLMWVSTGFPTLVKTPTSKDKNVLKYFHFTPTGIYAYIEMLTTKQRLLLAKAAKNKYNINVSPDQIVGLILSKFQCSINLLRGDGKVILIGKVTSFRKFPLRLDFSAPLNSAERILFDQYLKNAESEEHTDLRLECEAASRGKELKSNTLSITINQINQFGLTDKLFGPANNTFVTRTQLSELASDVYSSLNIVEEYQIPKFQFKEEFILEIIRQTAAIAFAPVTFEDALKTLSKYTADYSQDIAPDKITSDMGKIFKVENMNGTKYIKVNRENYDSTRDDLKIDTAVGAEVNILGKIGISSALKTAFQKTNDWSKGTTSLAEQLKEINTEYQNDVQWKIDGEKIVPKTLNVAKLSKASFSKTIVFNRVRKQYYDAPFQRKFSIYVKKYSDRESKARFPVGTIVAVISDTVLSSFDEAGKGSGEFKGWLLCDGRNETPDLRGRFLVNVDSNSQDYKTLGATGGQKTVTLTVDQLPSHTHTDPGHEHTITIQTSNDGNHQHEYKDVFWSEGTFVNYGDYVITPERFGTGAGTDNDNQGIQMRRYTEHAGAHSHTFTGNSNTAHGNIQNTGGSKPHENRPPFFVSAFIVFRG